MTRKLILCGLVAGLLATPALAVDRVSATEKGSLLIFPKVEIRWDVSGNVIQDTFIDIANDYPLGVEVQMYFINGDAPLPAAPPERAHPGWNSTDVGIFLTANQPTYWSAATGQPANGGLPPFNILDPNGPGQLPGRPAPEPGATDRVMRGYVVAWAVNNLGEEIRWNHLKGDVTIVNYMKGTAWEYNAYTFSVVAPGIKHGDVLPDPGTMLLDGTEYEPGFDLLLLDFYKVGSEAFSKPGYLVSIDTDLTLLPISVDLRQETDGPVTTKASFTIWDMNETKLTGLDRCVTCWDQTLLRQYGIPNHFVFMQTDKGKAQIDGLASQLCDTPEITSVAASLLGVAAKHLTFASGDYAAAGTNLIGMGTQGGVIRADLIGEPTPERPDVIGGDFQLDRAYLPVGPR